MDRREWGGGRRGVCVLPPPPRRTVWRRAVREGGGGKHAVKMCWYIFLHLHLPLLRPPPLSLSLSLFEAQRCPYPPEHQKSTAAITRSGFPLLPSLVPYSAIQSVRLPPFFFSIILKHLDIGRTFTTPALVCEGGGVPAGKGRDGGVGRVQWRRRVSLSRLHPHSRPT